MKLPFEVSGAMYLKDTQIFFVRIFALMLKYLLGFLLILSIINACFAVTNGQGIFAILSSFIYLIVFIFIVAGMSLVLGFFTYKKKKEQFESMHYTFSEDELLIKAIGFESKLAWSNFSKIKESSKYVLLYQGRIVTNLIPKRYFKNEKEVKELVDFVKGELLANS